MVLNVSEITDFNSADLMPYVSLKDTRLRKCEGGGIIIVESPKVIRTAISAGLKPLSMLCEKKHIEGDASDIISSNPNIPVFTGSRELLSSMTGYTLTRGVLCAMKRPELPPTHEILKHSKRVCVIYDVCDTTNIGAVFRTASALGFDGIILSSQSCDPFNRRSIRVSMGAVFQIPWCFEADVLSVLRQHGFLSISMALHNESIFLSDFKVAANHKYALIFGSEGYGLPSDIIERSDFVVKIPMHNGVDSLNVAASAAITLWHFSYKK